MMGMPKKPKRIHINRSDVWIVLTVLVLVSGMTFAVGMLLGYGVGEQHAAKVAQSTHGRDIASQHAVKEEDAAKLEIVEAYLESKQQALNELLNQQARRKDPKSIADAKAYFDSKGEDLSGVEGVESVARKPAAANEPAKVKSGRVPAAVKSLFEPSVQDAQKFIPTSEEWTIQVASYPTYEQAYAKMLLLKKNKIHEAYVHKIKTAGGSSWHSLFVGSYKNKAWSNRVASRLKKRKLIRDYKIKKVP